jgi:hypothetical protein
MIVKIGAPRQRHKARSVVVASQPLCKVTARPGLEVAFPNAFLRKEGRREDAGAV